MADFLQFSLIAFTSIFVLVDPFAAIPAFLAMTSDSAETRRRRMAARAAWTCLTVLAVFSIAGSFIFSLFGITLPAFKIAGGIILGLIGLDMVQARRSPTKETPGDTEESREKEDVGGSHGDAEDRASRYQFHIPIPVRCSVFVFFPDDPGHVTATAM